MKTKELKRFEIISNKTGFVSTKVVTSQDTFDVIEQFYHSDIAIYESVFILLLDRSNNTIGYAKISQGGISGTVVDVKIIGKYIVDTLASGLILAHNHPSGNLRASESDIKMTNNVKEVCKILDCTFLDSLIVTENGYTSLTDEGLI